MDLGLAGLKALVCGSSTGLGFAAAKGLAREGCQVALNGRSKERLENAAGQLAGETSFPVILSPGDLSIPEIPERVVQNAAAELGGLDILITNTGGPPAGKFEEFDDQDWQQAVELSFLSHMRLIRAALPYLLKSPHPSVLTVTSYSVKQPIPRLILSNSIRAATVGLTKSLALELGPKKIRFNSILPAYTETQRVMDLLEHSARAAETSLEEEKDRISSQSALGRMGKPEEFANAAVFLVSPAASFITGVMLTVDGGMYKGMI
jgi:3-oxoacyl-[acyl-carrier protein] reductase